jgi:hypothetical protein
MIPKLENYEKDFGAELLCPSCGGINLHHDAVEIFECGEDAKHGVHVTVADGKATMDTSLAGNPSGRRHGLKISLWCEQCHEKPVLIIKQHKGSTYLDLIPSGQATAAKPGTT